MAKNTLAICLMFLIASSVIYEAQGTFLLKMYLKRKLFPRRCVDFTPYASKGMLMLVTNLEGGCPATRHFKNFFELFKKYISFISSVSVSSSKNIDVELTSKCDGLAKAMALLNGAQSSSEDFKMTMLSMGKTLVEQKRKGTMMMTISQKKELVISMVKWTRLVATLVKTAAEKQGKSIDIQSYGLDVDVNASVGGSSESTEKGSSSTKTESQNTGSTGSQNTGSTSTGSQGSYGSATSSRQGSQSSSNGAAASYSGSGSSGSTYKDTTGSGSGSGNPSGSSPSGSPSGSPSASTGETSVKGSASSSSSNSKETSAGASYKSGGVSPYEDTTGATSGSPSGSPTGSPSGSASLSGETSVKGSASKTESKGAATKTESKGAAATESKGAAATESKGAASTETKGTSSSSTSSTTSVKQVESETSKEVMTFISGLEQKYAGKAELKVFFDKLKTSMSATSKLSTTDTKSFASGVASAVGSLAEAMGSVSSKSSKTEEVKMKSSQEQVIKTLKELQDINSQIVSQSQGKTVSSTQQTELKQTLTKWEQVTTQYVETAASSSSSSSSSSSQQGSAMKTQAS